MSEPPLTMFGEMERWQKAYSKESAMDANGWRPIESAPKNEFVLCLMQGGVCMVLYQDDNGDGLVDTWRSASGIQAGWPTHFMPLPPPPAQEEKP